MISGDRLTAMQSVAPGTTIIAVRVAPPPAGVLLPIYDAHAAARQIIKLHVVRRLDGLGVHAVVIQNRRLVLG